MKFSIKDFSSKCDQTRRKLRIWSHLLEKSLTENFIFCVVWYWEASHRQHDLLFQEDNLTDQSDDDVSNLLLLLVLHFCSAIFLNDYLHLSFLSRKSILYHFFNSYQKCNTLSKNSCLKFVDKTAQDSSML